MIPRSIKELEVAVNNLLPGDTIEVPVELIQELLDDEGQKENTIYELECRIEDLVDEVAALEAELRYD